MGNTKVVPLHALSYNIIVLLMDPFKYLFEKPAQSRRLASLARVIWYFLCYLEIHERTSHCRSSSRESSWKIPTHDWSIFWRINPEHGVINIHEIGIREIPFPRSARIIQWRLNWDIPTKTMAEYEACIIVFEADLDLNVKDLEVYEDPILIISQSIGELGGGGKISRIIQVQKTPNQDSWCLPLSVL